MQTAVPPLAERIRTLAASAVPTHVSLVGSSQPASPAAGGVDGAGRPVLLIRPGHALHPVREQLAVTVDLVAYREMGADIRSRGLLKARGWLETIPAADIRKAAVSIAGTCPDEALFDVIERPADPDGPRLLRIDIGHVAYIIGDEYGVLDAEEYFAASPDPLLEVAEAMIKHVNTHHRDRLRHAVDHLAGPVNDDTWLWELDRFGATIRVSGDTPTMIRLSWTYPVATSRGLQGALHQLIQHARI